jgi:hypothetical protein
MEITLREQTVGVFQKMEVEHFDPVNKTEKLTKNWYSFMKMLVVLPNNEN